MGGPGSGSWYRWNSSDTTESHKRIDIRYLRKRGYLNPGVSGVLSWTMGGEPSGSIRFYTSWQHISLGYRAHTHGDVWEEINEEIRLTETPCNYGRTRKWFICPSCSRRIAILYGAGIYFRCRHCYDLTYESQRERSAERAIRQSGNIIRRLGGDPEDENYPDKPKWMHWKTYDRLIAEAERCNDRGWGLLDKLIARYF